MKEKLALILALGVAVLAVIGMQRHLDRRERELWDEETVALVAAARELPEGTLLTPADLGSRRFPKRFRPPSGIDETDAAHAAGKRLLRARREGEPILWLDLPEPGRGLAERLSSGERAVSLPIDETSGLAGLLKPGDPVDVIGVFDETRGDAGRDRTARTLLTRMRVLAVGPATDPEGAPTGQSTVTLAASPAEAQLLALARHAAQLTLALRNPEDGDGARAPDVRESQLRDPEALREWTERRGAAIEIHRKGARER